MPDDEIVAKPLVDSAVAKGFNIFYGMPDLEMSHVHWDETVAGFDAFLDVAKKEGVTMLFVSTYTIDQSDIDDVKDDEDLKKQIRPHLGKCASFNASWIKGGTEYRYNVATGWWAKFLDGLDENDERRQLGIDR